MEGASSPASQPASFSSATSILAAASDKLKPALFRAQTSISGFTSALIRVAIVQRILSDRLTSW
jgi:hypothetical protein